MAGIANSRLAILRVWFAAIVSTALVLGVAAQADPLKVKTGDGKLHGKFIHNGMVRAFQGIPYAAPPVGNLRWQPPQPSPGWKGTLEAARYGRRCAQNNLYQDMAFQDSIGPSDRGSEDCLVLNVYTPAESKHHARLPVMFWIHGGGYVAGSGSEERHNGDFLPLKGVVLVTINYRLGVFGFLALPELAAEQNGASGNYGLMDQVAALGWVKKNIADFGGDPGNVTIFGESAGSYSVCRLMAAPSAQGLFQKAIGESGGAVIPGDVSAQTLAVRDPENEAWMKSAGAQTLAELRAMPMEKILDAALNHGFSPIVDGSFLPESVYAIYAEGKQAHIPLIAGFNRDEGESSAAGTTAETWAATKNLRFTEHLEQFFHLYPGSSDIEALRSASDFASDQFMAYGTWKWLELDRKTGDKDVYRYKFDLAAPPSKYHPGWYAFHSDDIEYVFGTLDTRPGAVWREEDRKLSDEMMSYWTNFAKTGDPNGLDSSGQPLPKWPRYGDGDPVLHLDTQITVRSDENRARYELWLETEK